MPNLTTCRLTAHCEVLVFSERCPLSFLSLRALSLAHYRLRLELWLRTDKPLHLIDGEKAATHVEPAYQRVFTNQFWPEPGMFIEEEGEAPDLTGPHYLLPFHNDLTNVICLEGAIAFTRYHEI